MIQIMEGKGLSLTRLMILSIVKEFGTTSTRYSDLLLNVHKTSTPITPFIGVREGGKGVTKGTGE